jgi:hypothetical protein
VNKPICVFLNPSKRTWKEGEKKREKKKEKKK